jgi:hypothetical protein
MVFTGMLPAAAILTLDISPVPHHTAALPLVNAAVAPLLLRRCLTIPPPGRRIDCTG